MSEPIPSIPDQDQTELERMLRASKPWFEKNGTLLIYALAAVLAIAAIWVFVSRQPAGDEQATETLYDALLGGGQGLRPEAFQDLADQKDGTLLGQWARLRQGEQLYGEALNNLFSNREVGVAGLENAKTTFNSLIGQSSVDSRIRERALIGLAKITEAECDGSDDSINKAVEAWQLVLTSYDDSIMKDHIQDRIDALAKPDTKEFYTWFQQQNPTPVEVPEIPEAPEAGSDSETGQSTATDSTATDSTDAAESNTETDGAETSPETPDATTPQPEEPQPEEPQPEEPQSEEPQSEEPQSEEPQSEEPQSEEPDGQADDPS